MTVWLYGAKLLWAAVIGAFTGIQAKKAKKDFFAFSAAAENGERRATGRNIPQQLKPMKFITSPSRIGHQPIRDHYAQAKELIGKAGRK